MNELYVPAFDKQVMIRWSDVDLTSLYSLTGFRMIDRKS